MKTTYPVLVNLILGLTFRTAQAGDNDSAVREGRLSLDEVTNVVLANNPAIKAAQEKWQAMKARVPQAAAWEDLRAQARSRVARYVSIPPNAFTDQSFILQQEVPISGKNLSRARAATAEAGAARYFPPNFRRTIAAQRADESASAVAAGPANSDSVSTTTLFIASVASCRPQRTTGNAASSKPGRSRKIPH